jgi:hypothetical protein
MPMRRVGQVFIHLFCVEAQIWDWRSGNFVCHLCAHLPKCEFVSHLPIGGVCEDRCLKKTAEALPSANRKGKEGPF